MIKMIEALENREDGYGHKFQDNDKKYLRFAALLHDVGHVPLSHVGERVLKKTYSAGIDAKSMSLEDSTVPRWTGRFAPEYLGPATNLHELLSAEMVLNSEEIGEVLSEEWPDHYDLDKARKRIAELIVGVGKNDTLSLLLHSELDADRLDYLLRDSFFTGVGYGHVDLDYVMSRLAVIRDDYGISSLCFELKGLHTVEHCIMGRFFLQTQVLFNRKVHLLDLLFMDVMEYMVRQGRDKDWGLMDLSDYLGHIRDSNGADRREHEHEIYKYTDAQVFMQMRALHEELDNELKQQGQEENSRSEKTYINDCTKTIMDGQVPNAVISHQIMLDALVDTEKVDQIREDAKQIADRVAGSLRVDPCRIKVDIIERPVMKYRSNDDTNREAVKITYLRDKDQAMEYVARSNASLLNGLKDKFLLICYAYYIRSKKEADDEVANREAVIRKAFQEFVLKYFQPQGMPCGCEEGEHLCQIIRGDNGLEAALRVASEPKFICRKCGRVACGEEHLCDGVAIGVDTGTR